MNQLSHSFLGPEADAAAEAAPPPIREGIIALFNEMWAEDHDVPPPPLVDDTILLETGFDSMAFAVLVMRLDELFGFDPFSMSEEPVYPVTFAEFVNFYEANKPK